MRWFALAAVILTAAGPAHAEEPYRLGKVGETPPTRVITLAPSITEIVIDLGLGEKLVGVSRHDDAPEVEGLPRVGGFIDPSPEAIVGLKPDLLLVQPSPGNRGIVERLAELGIPALILPLNTIDEILASMRAVSEALGAKDTGAALAKKLELGLARLEAEAAALPRRRALIVYSWKPLVVAGPDSFGDSLLRIAGGTNLAADASGPYPTLSAEAALAADPEVVIDASGGHGWKEGALGGWGPKIMKMKTTALFRPGPRIEEGAREIFEHLHPQTKTEAHSDRVNRSESSQVDGR